MKVWVPIAAGMTWKDVAKMFTSDWSAQFDITDDATITQYLGPYQDRIHSCQTKIVSKFTPNTTTAGRRAAAKRNKSTTYVLGKTKHL